MLKYVVMSSCTLIVVVVAFFAVQEEEPKATRSFSDEFLAKLSLPDDLPEYYNAASVTTDDAAPHYQKMIEYFSRDDIHAKLGNPKKDRKIEDIKPLVDMLLAGFNPGSCADGFADGYYPFNHERKPTYLNARKVLHSLFIKYADHLVHSSRENITPEDRALAEKIIQATFTFGRHLFERNVRISIRSWGLGTMNYAALKYNAMVEGKQLTDDAPKYRDAMQQWATHTQKIYKVFNDKEMLVRTPRKKFNIVDLSTIALKDKDPTFRVEAFLVLSKAQYWEGYRQFKKIAADTIKKGLEDDHDEVRRAAKLANETKPAARQVK